jgi:hypothetical protein
MRRVLFLFYQAENLLPVHRAKYLPSHSDCTLLLSFYLTSIILGFSLLYFSFLN